MKLRDEDHGHCRVDPAETPKPCNVLAIERQLRGPFELRVHRAKPSFDLLDREVVFCNDDAIDVVFDDELLEPRAMRLAPQLLARVEDIAATHEHLHETISTAIEILANAFAAATQVANRF